MKKITILSGIISVLLILTACHSRKAETPVILVNVTGEIEQVLHQMDTTMNVMSKQLVQVPILSGDARKILQDHFGKIPSVIELAITTPEGILSVIEPDVFKSSEGSDISQQVHIIKVKETKKPVLSAAFHAVEGFQGVVLAYPVLSANNELLGITTMLIRPEAFLKNIIAPVIEGVPVDIWVMQKDGIILYDIDAIEIGRNLFTDPLYKAYTESLKVAAKIADENKGQTEYVFLGTGMKDTVTNQAYWNTIDTYGNHWKVVMIKPVGDHDVKRTPATVGLKGASDRLLEMAADEEFVSCLSMGEKDVVLNYFKTFYDDYPIYSIEYVDSSVVCRYGYPPKQSLEDYRILPDSQSEKNFYETVVSGKEASFKQALLEGHTGTFYCVPVHDQGRYLGMIYYIVSEP
jgi:hypothetical protein